jgi:hypothetical protein
MWERIDANARDAMTKRVQHRGFRKLVFKLDQRGHLNHTDFGFEPKRFGGVKGAPFRQEFSVDMTGPEQREDHERQLADCVRGLRRGSDNHSTSRPIEESMRQRYACSRYDARETRTAKTFISSGDYPREELVSDDLDVDVTPKVKCVHWENKFSARRDKCVSVDSSRFSSDAKCFPIEQWIGPVVYRRRYQPGVSWFRVPHPLLLFLATSRKVVFPYRESSHVI